MNDVSVPLCGLETKAESASLTDPVGPAGYLEHARSYLKAAVDLPGDEDLWPPRFQLYGHAMELALKAFLLRSGVDEAYIRQRRIRHNLEELLKDADSRGLDVDAIVREWVAPKLNEIYFKTASGKDFSARYPLSGMHGFASPTREQMKDAIEQIIEQAS